ncbi:MAG TPA: M20/M25/M40 family metallo-hydrolase [bacterium]
METIDRLLEKLTSAAAIGYAGDAPQLVIEELKAAGLTAALTKDRSVHAIVNGTDGRDVIIACHLDEIGFVVTGIDGSGFIKINEVGKSDVRILIGQEMLIHGRETIAGYIGAKPPHLLSPAERSRVFPLPDLFVDTSMPVDALKSIVRIGDMVTFKNRYQKLHDSLRSAKAMDNRASVAAGIMALVELQKHPVKPNVHFVATSQEEFSGLGARLLSQRVHACCAIIVDVTFGDQPDLPETEVFPLASGPTLGRGGTLPAKFFKLLVQCAQELGIPYQVEPLPTNTGTDADSIAFSVDGIPCCLLGIPVRNMHTPVEVVSLQDIERTSQLIVHFVKKL